MNGIPTHFERQDVEPVAIDSHAHLSSEHVKAAHPAGWTLVTMDQGMVDDAWVAKRPMCNRYRSHPVSFAMVWRKTARRTVGGARLEQEGALPFSMGIQEYW
jgi:hypothetical protein